MKNLREIVKDIEGIDLNVVPEINIEKIQYDSRKVSQGDLFVAISGEAADGHDFIDAAVKQQAGAVICEDESACRSVPCIVVEDTRKALALMSAAYFGYPASSLELIGITGTNGKTSTAYLVESILHAGRIPTGTLGTIEYRIGGRSYDAKWTTPESLELHGLLNEMRESGVEKAVMEVSSHALEQFRIEGLSFRAAVFTNLSQDHLDYHRSMERYSSAKQRLFRQVDSEKGENIINGDDQNCGDMIRQNHRPAICYSVQKGNADIYPLSARFTRFGIDAKLVTPAGEAGVNSKLIGRHNLYNIMAAVGVGISLGLPIDQIEHGINSFELVPGRLEPVNEGQGFLTLVDYAHTPDAMEKVLTAVKPLVKGKLITVFGCGGDRDRGKRPLMGQIAEKGSDISILTSDNPRTEDPERIIDDVLTGVKYPEKMQVFIDRTAAIKWAINSAEDDDCVLILGKGHETYQVLGRNRIDYDDREIARNFIKQASN